MSHAKSLKQLHQIATAMRRRELAEHQNYEAGRHLHGLLACIAAAQARIDAERVVARRIVVK